MDFLLLYAHDDHSYDQHYQAMVKVIRMFVPFLDRSFATHWKPHSLLLLNAITYMHVSLESMIGKKKKKPITQIVTNKI